MTIKVATIGTNFIVDSFVKGASLDPRFEYHGVYSRNEVTAGNFAAKYGVPKTYTSLEKLAEDKDIDAVYIASPNICHCEQAIYLMQKGKHILCEKPMGTSAEEVRKMTKTALKNKVTFMEAMKTTLLPNFLRIKEELHKIGKVHFFSASFCQYSSRFENFKEGKDIPNVFSPEMKGGALRDLGVYCIAPLVHLFGMPYEGEFSKEKLSRKIRVLPLLMSPGGMNQDKAKTDVQGVMCIEYPDMQAVLTYSKICDGLAGMEIRGENGIISVSKTSTMLNPVMQLRSDSGDKELRGQADCRLDLSVPTPDFMFPEIKEFFDLIESGKTESELNTFGRSMNVARIVDAGLDLFPGDAC